MINRRSHTRSRLTQAAFEGKKTSRNSTQKNLFGLRNGRWRIWTYFFFIVECLWSISDFDAAMCSSARASAYFRSHSQCTRSNFSFAAIHRLTLRQASYQFIILLFNSIFVLISYRSVHARRKISPETASARKREHKTTVDSEFCGFSLHVPIILEFSCFFSVFFDFFRFFIRFPLIVVSPVSEVIVRSRASSSDR